MIGQVAAAHSTKCIKEDGRDNLHQLYYGTGPATMPSGNAAKKSGKGDKQKRKESYAIYI